MHQVGSSLHDFIEMHGQQNIKFIYLVTCLWKQSAAGSNHEFTFNRMVKDYIKATRS